MDVMDGRMNGWTDGWTESVVGESVNGCGFMDTNVLVQLVNKL